MNNESSVVRSYSNKGESVRKRAAMLHKAQEEARTKKEMLSDYLLSDEEYLALQEKAKDARERLSAHKMALMNEPENVRLRADLKDLQVEIKDTKKLLGDELLAYFIENKSLEIETERGEKVRYQISARISKNDQLSLFS